MGTAHQNSPLMLTKLANIFDLGQGGSGGAGAGAGAGTGSDGAGLDDAGLEALLGSALLEQYQMQWGRMGVHKNESVLRAKAADAKYERLLGAAWDTQSSWARLDKELAGLPQVEALVGDMCVRAKLVKERVKRLEGVLHVLQARKFEESVDALEKARLVEQGKYRGAKAQERRQRMATEERRATAVRERARRAEIERQEEELRVRARKLELEERERELRIAERQMAYQEAFEMAMNEYRQGLRDKKPMRGGGGDGDGGDDGGHDDAAGGSKKESSKRRKKAKKNKKKRKSKKKDDTLADFFEEDDTISTRSEKQRLEEFLEEDARSGAGDEDENEEGGHDGDSAAGPGGSDQQS